MGVKSMWAVVVENTRQVEGGGLIDMYLGRQHVRGYTTVLTNEATDELTRNNTSGH